MGRGSVSMLICKDTLAALRKLKSDTVHAGITSPPYNKMENKKGWLVTNVKYDNSSDKLPEQEYQRRQIMVLDELYRVMRPGGSFFYNHKIRWERGEMLHPLSWLSKTKWTLRQEIIWDRKIAANIRGWRFWQVEERIYWLHKPANGCKIGKEIKSCHAKLSSIWRISPERKNTHPAPFPLVVPLRAIYSVMDDKKGVVIDPYCGSGTTCVAAKLLGLKYIGIDISPAYIKMARQRIKGAEAERHIWKSERENHVVRDTFENKKRENRHVGRYRGANSGRLL